MKTFTCILSAVSLVALSAAAQTTNEYDDVEEIIVKDFIGTLTVEVGRGDVRVEANSGADSDYSYWVKNENGALTIHSDEDPEDQRWSRKVNWRGDQDKAFEKFLEDYPTVKLRVPAGTDLLIEDTVLHLTAGDLASNVEIGGSHVEGVLGDLASADIGIHGSGDISVGNVAEELAINIHGSGDFDAGNAGALSASIHGSGDISLRDIDGPATARIHGSGDITFGDIDGAIDVETHGSGDVLAGVVSGGASAKSHGSGDLSLKSISGPASFSQHGSGDVEIGGGRAENLKVRIAGSGDFDFGGLATNPDVTANGSGDAHIARHEGTVRTSGRGDIRISGVRYGDDD